MNNYRNKAASILMIAIMTICMLLPSGCRPQDKTKLEEIQEKGVLRVGTTGDYMPMSYLDPATGAYVRRLSWEWQDRTLPR